jgi:hypothetical protein
VRRVPSIMQTSITREAIIDRRQPAIRWSAVFAGTALAVATWLLLHLIGLGIGLAAVDLDDAGSLRHVGIGTTVWSLIAALIAMFVGGMFAGKLAGSYDRKVAGAHGLVVGSLTAVLGVGTLLWLVTGVAGTFAHHRATSDAPVAEVGDVDTTLSGANQRLRAEGRPGMTTNELRAASRAIERHGRFDRDQIVDDLTANTRLTHADAVDIASQLIDRSDDTTLDAQKVADATGRGLAAVGIALLLGIAASVLGGVLALHDWTRKSGGGGGRKHHWLRRHQTEPGPYQQSAYPPVVETPPEIGG